MPPRKLLLAFVFFPDAFLPLSSSLSKPPPNNPGLIPAPPANKCREGDFAPLLILSQPWVRTKRDES